MAAFAINHAFTCTLPTDPAATAAGEVTPDNWNAALTYSGILPAANVGAGGSTGQVQYNNAGVLGGITGSTVSGSTVGFTVVQTPKVQATGNLALNSGFGSVVITSPFQIHGTASSDILFTDGWGSTLQMDANGGIGAQNNTGASYNLLSDGSFFAQGINGNFVNIDPSGGVSLRAVGDQGGINADASGYTNIGQYSTSGHNVTDPYGNTTIAASGALPNGYTALQVGPDIGSGAYASFDNSFIGGQMFTDFNCWGSANSFRVMTDAATGLEFGVSYYDGEFHTDALAGDAVFKGNLSASNNFRWGAGSGASAVSLLSTGELLVGRSTTVGFGLLQVAGNGYFSGNVSIGTSSNSARLYLAGGTTTLAPLRFNSAAFTTSAGAGSMEWNGTNLAFVRAGTTRESVLCGNSGATAPSTTATPSFTSYYGGNTKALGDPVSWAGINIGGTAYKIPLYT